MSVMCAYCGRNLEEDEVYSMGDVIMCEDCYDSNTRTCDCCGERIWNGDDEGDDDIILCRHCRDNHYTTCEDCGRLIHDDDAYYVDDDSDYPYCHSCYINHKRKYIHSYSYKPEPIFHGDGSLYMGVELEIDGAGCDDDNAEKLCDIADKSQLYIKTDGSLDEGMELVTHPMTLEYHQNNSIAKMSETVSGSFCFSILTDKNEVYLVKGSNPLAIYDCDGYYVYASTSDILDKTLKKLRIKKKEKVEIKSGEILKISADGTIERSTFNNDDYDYPYYPYRGKYFDYGFDDDENELDALIMYAGYFGIDESDIMILIDLGYDAMEIEELMYDPVMLKEIVGECREMMACEIGG